MLKHHQSFSGGSSSWWRCCNICVHRLLHNSATGKIDLRLIITTIICAGSQQVFSSECFCSNISGLQWLRSSWWGWIHTFCSPHSCGCASYWNKDSGRQPVRDGFPKFNGKSNQFENEKKETDWMSESTERIEPEPQRRLPRGDWSKFSLSIDGFWICFVPDLKRVGEKSQWMVKNPNKWRNVELTIWEELKETCWLKWKESSRWNSLGSRCKSVTGG